MIEFTVDGIPAPQGSKRPLRNKHTGRIHMVESSKKLPAWRADVREAATRLMFGGGPLDGAAFVGLIFYLPRPKGHFGTGRNAGLLKPSAPAYPTGRPDIDKLARAVLDAITGVIIRDDAQVVSVSAGKLYATNGRGPCVEISVEEDA